jgi:hypothetical protein
VRIFKVILTSMFFSGASIALPQPPEIKQNDNLSAKFSAWTVQLQIDADSRNTNGAYALGIGALGGVGPESSVYIDTVNAAYQQALSEAYIQLATNLSDDGLNVATELNIDQKSQTGNALEQKFKRNCETEAKKVYELHQINLARAEEDKNSFINLIKNKLKSEEELAKEASTTNEIPEKDFIHKCEYEGQEFSQNSTTEEVLADILSGAGVFASAIHNDQLAVIVKRSPNSAAAASSLLNQTLPANVNDNALKEISEKVKLELSRQPDIPQGLVGTRLTKLSNGEWAIYAYGASQSDRSDTFMSGLSDIQDTQVAQTRALAELARFSEFTVDFGSILQELRDVKETKIVTVNLTKGTTRLTTKKDALIGRIMDRSFSSQSSLKLKGSQNVMLANKTVDGTSMYIAAFAWSPSLMSKKQDIRSAQDSAVINKKTTANTEKNKSKIIVVGEDW